MTQCKERCWKNIGYQFTVQCSRKATRDGYCGHHHPEGIKKKNMKARAKHEESELERKAEKEHRVRRWCAENNYKLVKK